MNNVKAGSDLFLQVTSRLNFLVLILEVVSFKSFSCFRIK